MKAQDTLGALKTPSIKDMAKYLQNNPLKILFGDMVNSENKKPEKGIKEILTNIVLSKENTAERTAELLSDYAKSENVKGLAKELSSLFDDLNIVNLLYEYKDEKNLLTEIFTPEDFKGIITSVFAETLKKPDLLCATKLLVEAGVDINAEIMCNRLPIHYAAQYGNVAAMKYCVSKSNNINVASRTGSCLAQTIIT